MSTTSFANSEDNKKVTSTGNIGADKVVALENIGSTDPKINTGNASEAKSIENQGNIEKPQSTGNISKDGSASVGGVSNAVTTAKEGNFDMLGGLRTGQVDVEQTRVIKNDTASNFVQSQKGSGAPSLKTIESGNFDTPAQVTTDYRYQKETVTVTASASGGAGGVVSFDTSWNSFAFNGLIPVKFLSNTSTLIVNSTMYVIKQSDSKIYAPSNLTSNIINGASWTGSMVSAVPEYQALIAPATSKRTLRPASF